MLATYAQVDLPQPICVTLFLLGGFIVSITILIFQEFFPSHDKQYQHVLHYILSYFIYILLYFICSRQIQLLYKINILITKINLNLFTANFHLHWFSISKFESSSQFKKTIMFVILNNFCCIWNIICIGYFCCVTNQLNLVD